MRTILHCDMNNFFASCEIMENPELKKYPVAVCGSQDERHGIVLAKNQKAKLYDIKTGEVIWQAKNKCPNLVIVPPHYDLYLKYSNLAREIYSIYTDKIEPYGIDECWLDVSQITDNEYTGKDIADELREQMKEKLGLTISVGVSFNKVFAKLGSDMKKPDAVTVISKDSFKEKIWNLSASDLLFVGPRIGRELDSIGVTTIGRLANCPSEILKRKFGIIGPRLKSYANGEDDSPVMTKEYTPPVKSIGNGITFLDDLYTNEEVKNMIYRLSLNFSSKLTKIHKKAKGVSIVVRDNSLFFKEWQTRLPYPTIVPKVIADEAYKLFLKGYKWLKPIRSITVRVIDLVDENESIQINLFEDYETMQKKENLAKSVDDIKTRFGKFALRPCALLSLPKYPEFSQVRKATPPGGSNMCI